MLDGHVLVLNRVFQAVQITSVRRALTLLYKGQVRAVDAEYRTYDFENWLDVPVQPMDNFVRTPTRNILIPHVVQLLAFDRLPRQEVKFSRGNIYLRPEPLPVLRQEVSVLRALARPRRADLARRKVDMGE